MLDERLKTRDESKNVIASIAKQSIIILFVATFFSACTDYQEEFENAFGALEYVHESSDSAPESSDGKTVVSSSADKMSSSKEKSSSSAKSSSSVAPASSGTTRFSRATRFCRVTRFCRATGRFFRTLSRDGFRRHGGSSARCRSNRRRRFRRTAGFFFGRRQFVCTGRNHRLSIGTFWCRIAGAFRIFQRPERIFEFFLIIRTSCDNEE